MNKKVHLFFLIFLALMGTQTSFVWAQNPARQEPLEITADGSLEWQREQRIFTARENALAQQGDMSLSSRIITADYREDSKGALEIWRVTASDNVVLRSQDSKAYGEKAVYNIDEGLAVMTGKNLKMISPDQTVTAKESFEYWVTDGRLVAIGNAKVDRPKPTGDKDMIQSDKITAILKDNAQGKRELHSMEAVGNVIITTPTEVVTGAYGIYNAQTNKATLTGGVKIRRGPNILEGDKAEIDTVTNTSRIFGSSVGDGRVRGVFYPSSEQKQE